ncbi:MAG TPA: hypothetical protein VF615_22105 [Longimicrobiaceae bacterium]|jgi:hypothetical protein
MEDDLPVVDLDERVQGTGELQWADFSLPVPTFSLHHRKFDSSGAWAFSGSIRRPDSATRAQLGRSGGICRLIGRTDAGRDIVIPELHLSKIEWSDLGVVSAGAYQVYWGPDRLAFEPVKQDIVVHLSNNDIAQPPFRLLETRWDGQVEGRFEQPPFAITSALGLVEFSKHYTFEKVDVVGMASTVQIARPVISIQLSPENCTRDVHHLFARVSDELGDLVQLISFLSRHRVSWYRMASMAWGANPHGPMRIVESEFSRTGGGSGREAYLERLVNPFALAPNGLDELLKNFQALAVKEALAHAIGHVIAAVRQGAIESQMVSAFTAVEAVVSAVGEQDGSAYAIRGNAFKLLQSRVRDLVRAFAAERQLDAVATNSILGKVPALQRRPIIPRLVEMIRRHSVTWKDLWPSGADLEEGLRAAYRRRNNLIHAGILQDGYMAAVDRHRMHALAERLIFSLLGGRDEWLDESAYGHCEYLTASPL